MRQECPLREWTLPGALKSSFEMHKFSLKLSKENHIIVVTRECMQISGHKFSIFFNICFFLHCNVIVIFHVFFEIFIVFSWSISLIYQKPSLALLPFVLIYFCLYTSVIYSFLTQNLPESNLHFIHPKALRNLFSSTSSNH